MPKVALIAAAAGCLALTLATPAQAAVTADGEETPLGYCPRPGAAELVAETPSSPVGDLIPAAAVPVLAEADRNTLRVATFNANLSRDDAGKLYSELAMPGTEDAVEAARIIQTVRPDVLVLTGIDVDSGERIAKAFSTNYLAVGNKTHTGMTYPYRYTSHSNAGVDSGADLDHDGIIGGPGDALGYGEFPGQASMIVYSKYPIDTENIRDFSSMPWQLVPNHGMPEHFSELEQAMLPLASVSHWDVPIDVAGQTIHLLATAAANGTATAHAADRNADQLRFWQDYLEPDSEYIRDHRGMSGPLAADAAFVLAGSLKADPDGSGPGDATAIQNLLDSDAVFDPQPERTLPPNALGHGVSANNPDAKYHTAPDPTNTGSSYRADYVLVDADMTVTGSGILESGTETSDFFRGHFGDVEISNTNHIVWADISLD